MDLLRGVLIELVLTALLALIAIPIAYVANFQRTILLVGRRLGAEKRGLLPESLRSAITPRKLIVWNGIALLLLALLGVSCFVVGWYVLIVPLLLFVGISYSPLLLSFLFVPQPGHGHYLAQIWLHLFNSRRRYLDRGDNSKAEQLAELSKRMQSLGDLTEITTQ